MAKLLRKQMKRKLAQSVQYCVKICENVSFIREQFVDDHPEWLPAFDAIIQSQCMQIDFLVGLAKRAWGYYPDNIETWLK